MLRVVLTEVVYFDEPEVPTSRPADGRPADGGDEGGVGRD